MRRLRSTTATSHWAPRRPLVLTASVPFTGDLSVIFATPRPDVTLMAQNCRSMDADRRAVLFAGSGLGAVAAAAGAAIASSPPAPRIKLRGDLKRMNALV